MTTTLQDNIRGLISYYNHHKVEEMIKKHPSFVAEDFTRLLAELEKLIEANEAWNSHAA